MTEKFTGLLIQLIDPGEAEDMPFPLMVIVDILGLVVFGGMLISVVSNILERRVEAYQSGETTYKLKDHLIILGYNNSVPSLVKTLRILKDGSHDEETFILIQSGQDTSEIRAHLHMGVDDWIERNTLIIRGQSNSKEDLKKLNVGKCRQVYIIGDSTLEAHDSTNMESVQLLSELWREESPEQDITPLSCSVLFEHQTFYSVFQCSELSQEIRHSIRFHPFNLHENWAKKVIVEGKAGSDAENNLIRYLPIEGENGLQKNSTKRVHLIVIGMSRMGTALAVETAQTAHYPNFREDDDRTRTQITFIDSNAEEEMETFQSRFPHVFDMMRWRFVDVEKTEDLYTLSGNTWHDPIAGEGNPYKHLGPNFTDIQWEFIRGRSESSAVRRYLVEAIQDDAAITTVAICFPDTQQASQTALYLPDQVLRNAHQVLVYQTENDAIIRNVNNPSDHYLKYDRVFPFGIISDSYSNDNIGEEEGKWINAYYTKYTKEYGSDADKSSWNEKDEKWADKIWENTSVSSKWSSIHSANMLYSKLRTVGCTRTDDIEKIRAAFVLNMQDLICLEHNRWVTEKLLSGFRPFNSSEWIDYQCQEKKRSKNNAERAHANICSNATLKKEEPNSHAKDEQVTLALLEIIEKLRNH